MDRYQVDTCRGEPGIRTNSRAEAEKWAVRWETGVKVIAHRGAEHRAGEKPTSIMRGVVSDGQFEPTSHWERL